jgi:hypothetical protein
MEYVTTRCAKMPLSADDPDMEEGWRWIPIPPTADPRWFIVEDRDRNCRWAIIREPVKS